MTALLLGACVSTPPTKPVDCVALAESMNRTTEAMRSLPHDDKEADFVRALIGSVYAEDLVVYNKECLGWRPK